MRSPHSALLAVVASIGLGACAVLPAPNRAVPDNINTPTSWQAPLPHDGKVADLGRWWQQFDDHLLADLIDKAQAASPSIASARSRIEQARAARVTAGAALLPTLDASASLSRDRKSVV